jgi:glyceraldehyde 3-phosphate dehydrogenase
VAPAPPELRPVRAAAGFGGGGQPARRRAAASCRRWRVRWLPHLNGKLNGTALRVPTDTGSVVEAVYQIDGTPSKEELVAALAANADQINGSTLLGQVITVNDYYECSRDCVGEPFSSMVSDSPLVVPVDGSGSLVKLTSFYDNEMGFSHRMAELALIFAAA